MKVQKSLRSEKRKNYIESTRPIQRPGRWKRAGTRAVLACAIGLSISGCGGAPPQSETIERQYFTLRDEQGNERLTPAEELFDGAAGEDIATLEILVLDRKTGSETWVLLADLGREPPALARYVPRTRTETEVDELTSAAQ